MRSSPRVKVKTPITTIAIKFSFKVRGAVSLRLLVSEVHKLKLLADKFEVLNQTDTDFEIYGVFITPF